MCLKDRIWWLIGHSKGMKTVKYDPDLLSLEFILPSIRNLHFLLIYAHVIETKNDLWTIAFISL